MPNKIYEAALGAENKMDLFRKLTSLQAEPNFNIDEKMPDAQLTPAAMLVYQDVDSNNVKKVKVLSQFGADPVEIVKAYVMTCNAAPIEYYFKVHEDDPSMLSRFLNVMNEKVLDNQEFTCVSKFAYEDVGNLKAEQLKIFCRLGADVTEIVKAYAMAGNHAAIEYYFEKYKANPSILNELIRICVLTYVSADNKNLIDKLYERYPLVLSLIAKNYALTGKEEEAAEYYSTHIMNFPDQKETLLPAIVGNIVQNNGVLTNSEFKKAVQEDPRKFDTAIVIGYARSGRTQMLMTYLSDLKQKNLPDFDEICNEAFFASAANGHHTQVEQLYKEFLNKDTNSHIINGYMSNKDNRSRRFDVECILQDYLIQRRADKEPGQEVPREYKHNWLPKFFQKSYTKKEAAVKALEAALRGEKVSLKSSHLATLRNGTLGDNLREFIKKGGVDYLEIDGKLLVGEKGKKIRTVTDFVRAVDKLVNSVDPGPTAGS